MKSTFVHSMLLTLALTAMAAAAEPEGIRAALLPAEARKAAPNFALQDASGETIKLKKYRGKVVVVDFWATWCTGCKKEIPWFSEFQRAYGRRRLAVIGVSLDEDGWKALRPFLAEHSAQYRMVLGNDAVARQYGIKAMPDTFLIDRQGRIAAAYLAGLVDKDDLDANILAMISER